MFTYTVQENETVWQIAAILIDQTTYATVPALVYDIKVANPSIVVWWPLPAGTVLVIPGALWQQA